VLLYTKCIRNTSIFSLLNRFFFRPELGILIYVLHKCINARKSPCLLEMKFSVMNHLHLWLTSLTSVTCYVKAGTYIFNFHKKAKVKNKQVAVHHVYVDKAFVVKHLHVHYFHMSVYFVAKRERLKRKE